MKTRFVSFLSVVYCLLATTFAIAQKNKPASPDAPLRASLLWEVKGKGIRTSYLFGTIHVIPSKDFFLSDTTRQAFKKTKQLVLEMDMSNPLAMGVQMLSLAPMKNNQTLSSLLSAEDYQTVKAFFDKSAAGNMGLMSFDMMETWKPMLLQTTLYQDGIGVMGSNSKSYEMELIAMAQTRKMSFGGLETIADQMNIFEQIPYKDQAAALVQSIKDLQANPNATEEEMQKVIQLYKAQNIEGMVEMTDTEMTNIEDASEVLLNQRNRKWIAKIKEYAAQKPTFFAVGAGHLGGMSGVVKLLIQEGFTLTPLH